MSENLFFMIMVVLFIAGIATKHEFISGAGLLMALAYIFLTHFGYFSQCS